MSINQHIVARAGGSVNAYSDRVVIGNQQVAFNSASSPITSVTVTAPGSYTAMPTLSTTGNGSGANLTATLKAATATLVTSQSGSGSYAPGDTITLAGTGTQTILTIVSTQVISATIVSGGSGGTNGAAVVNGTTGAGSSKVQLNVTIAGGAITAINSISNPGTYTTNPTNLTAEPVGGGSGGSLTGATVSLKMGAFVTTITTPGSLTAVSANPVAQSATSGSGTGATFNLTYGLNTVNVVSGGTGYDSTSALVVSGSGGGAGTLVLSTVGAAVTVPVSFFDLPLNSSAVGTYGVFVNPGQDCRWYVPQSSKTSQGFNVVLQPVSTASIVAGTLDVVVIA